MFSFIFDFSGLGDPSLLSTQANIACWAEGQDDAGWNLQASTGNSKLDPWLSLPLSNEGPDVAINDVTVSGTKESGTTMRLGIQLLSAGEAIDEPFNVSIFTEIDGERTLVGREVVSKIGTNTITTLRSTLTVPSGTWTLHVEADAEQLMWEVDETNNAWNATFSPAPTSFGSATMLAGGAVGIAMIGVSVVFWRRRAEGLNIPTLDADEPTPKKPLRGPPQRTSEPKAKPAGLKGPPERKAPEPSPTSTIDGASTLDALLQTPPTAAEAAIGSSVNEWSLLPPGGEYDYGLGETLYKGEQCGTWRMNEDKTFTKIE